MLLSLIYLLLLICLLVETEVWGEMMSCSFLLQDSGFLDGAFESQNAALGSLSRLLYDELVKSILRVVEKLDLSVQKITTGEEVRGPFFSAELEELVKMAGFLP